MFGTFSGPAAVVILHFSLNHWLQVGPVSSNFFFVTFEYDLPLRYFFYTSHKCFFIIITIIIHYRYYLIYLAIFFSSLTFHPSLPSTSHS